MQIKATTMRKGKESREQETVFSANRDGKKVIAEWVKWFKKELVTAMKQGEDVEIIVGMKPNDTGAVV